MSVITVSRQLGSLGGEIAIGVAETLGFRLVDQEIIYRAAQEAGVPKIALQELAYEGRRDLADRVLRAVYAMPPLPGRAETQRREASSSLGSPFGGLFSPALPSFAATLKDYVDMVEMVIRHLALEGNVVIAGQGGQVLLRHMPGTLHVQIVAPLEHRVTVLAQRESITKEESTKKIRASDQTRRHYLRTYHHVDWLDPTLYDLVINTYKIRPFLAAEMIVRACRELSVKDHD
jgi:cytidylate kinase